MTHFPVLSGGALCQYPLIRTANFRTIISALPDGSSVKLSDSALQQLRWELAFQGLTRDEWTKIESFFQEQEGRLGTFQFLDPADNLLTFSEDFMEGVWVKGPGLSLTAGGTGPLQSTTATRVSNQALVPQRVEQVAGVPADFLYCWSVYARADNACDLSLVLRAGTSETVRRFRVGSEWGRVAFSGSPGVEGEQVSFGAEIDPGAAVEISVAQVECQASPSPYKHTQSLCGIYPRARFDTDSLAVSIQGEDHYNVKLLITARR